MEGSGCTLGNAVNFWKYSGANGYDLTRHGDRPSGAAIQLQTTTVPITVDPARAALVIIDMQNFFLHPSVRAHEPGLAASQQLLDKAIPAARRAGMQIIWLNWGLTDEDIEQAPPALQRMFASDKIAEQDPDRAPNAKRIYLGLGTETGEVVLANGDRVDGGRMLMRGTWNAQLYEPLRLSYEQSQTTAKPDQWFHKNRISGLWAHQSPLLSYLQENQLVTLFFAGVNTDQCVLNTVDDAFSKGFDCILMRDGCGTTSPPLAREFSERKCQGGLGFMLDADVFANGIDSSLRSTD